MNGFYAGSFDPLTNGHLYVLKQAAQIFDEVVIGLGNNAEKIRFFDAEQMKTAIEAVAMREQLKNVRVIVYGGLTATRARQEHCDFLIRGLRDGIDYSEEEVLARTNFAIGGIETIYFRAGDGAYISSSTVRELAKNEVNIEMLVPTEISSLINN